MSRRSRSSKRRLNSLFMVTILTAMLLLSSTYAWFSANRVVELTGINAKVSAAEGLQISLDGEKWSSKLTINSEKLAAATGNKYQWPSELVPVSTTGATTSGNLNLFYGDVVDDGANLTTVNPETDPATGTTGSGKYIVFDIYLKNSSSQKNDTLQFTSGTKVAINAEDGKTGTGLENCIRAGVVLWGGSTAMTAQGTDVRAIEVETAKTCIWEPNYLSHIAEVTTNDTRVSEETAEKPFKTFGLLKGGNKLEGINGTAKTDFMDIQQTLTTAGGSFDSDTNMTNLGGENLQLEGNAIMKARVYIWLEGQDPDCIDTASTGKSIDVALGFTKPTPDKATP